MRVLASHQCGPGLIPGPGVTYMWVEFVVGSRPCSEGFFPGSFGFSSLLKKQHFQIPILFSVTLVKLSQINLIFNLGIHCKVTVTG